MGKVNDVVTWFEVPVSDMDRAVSFYSKMLNVDMKAEAYGPTTMAVFPIQGEGVHGALVKASEHKPSDQGTLVYFNGGEDLAPALGRAKAAGAKVIREKFNIGQHGFIAILVDTEGNRIALHSMK